MSCIYKGQVIESELSQNSKGGTEMMRQRVIDNVDPELLKDFAIHFSRPRQLKDDVMNILYCHDLAEDPENQILQDGGWEQFDHFVFVSHWQRDMYMMYFGIPFSKCSVIPNAVEKNFEGPKDKTDDTIRFIYHTTPHRGLELLVPVIDALSKEYPNIHLDVYSSFNIYGWPVRDEPYKVLFKQIEDHPNMTYHGAVSNEEVLAALDKADIFLYPNIWRETSCIAMIEAIKSGVLCIHPNYAALPETAANATIMYDMHEDRTIHANIAYSYAKQVLEQAKDPEFFKRFTSSDRMSLPNTNIQLFGHTWNKLLRDLKA